MDRKKNETIIKVFTLVCIVISLITLYITGTAFALDFYTKTNTILHHLAAAVIILFFVLHTWLRRCSLRKLIQEFKDILAKKQLHNEDNKSLIIQNIKNKPLKELATFFHWDITQIENELPLHHVKVQNTNDTLKEIAQQNDKDLYDIFILITKIHIEKNISEPVLTSFC
ncbi:hypothetical protein [Sulfurospirillum arcachonense]|uniref:hypothetical protein n=1 Tax=Sulfurospirillum arcachonense TaxID=57666 RepID=UPI0004691D36|nr:hypothetical protein [Sulfurospirillum arcachonense]